MKCSVCGFEIDEKAYSVCPFCGTAITYSIESEECTEANDDEYKKEVIEKYLIEHQNIIESDEVRQKDNYVLDIDVNKSNLIVRDDCITLDDFDISVEISEGAIPSVIRKAINRAGFSSIGEIWDFILVHDIKTVFEILKPHYLMVLLSSMDQICRGNTRLKNIIPSLFKTMVFNRIDATNEAMPLEILMLLGVTSRLISLLKDIGLERIQDFENTSYDKFLSIMSRERDDGIFNFFNAVSMLEQSGGMLLNDVIQDTPSHYIEIANRRANGESLESISLSYGLTRERIRQLQVKFVTSLAPFRDWIIGLLNTGNEYFMEQEISDFLLQYPEINQHAVDLVLFSFQNDKRFEYLDFASCLCRIGDTKHYHEELIDNIVSTIIGTDFMYIPDILEKVEGEFIKLNYDFMGYEELSNYFMKYGYHIFNKYVCKNSTPLNHMCKLEIIKHFPNGVKTTCYDKQTDSNDLELMRKYLYEDFNQIATDNDRALSATIQRSDTFLSGRGRWNIPENIVIDFDLLESIVKFIDDNLVDTLHYDTIYREFSGALSLKTTIDCSECLHGVLRYYYPDKYDYRRDYLVYDGSPIVESGLTFYDRMNEYMRHQNRVVSIQEIQDALGKFSIYSISQYASDSKDYCYMGNNEWIHVDCFYIDDIELEKYKVALMALLSKQMNYCSSVQAYRLALQYIPEMLNCNELIDDFRFASFLEYVGKDYLDVRKPHILKKNTLKEDISYDTVLKYLIKDEEIVSRKHLMKWGHDIGLSSIPLDFSFNRLCLDMIQINNDKYINTENQDAFSNSVGEVCKYIESNMENGYFSLFLEHSYSDLPYTGYRWNNYIVRSLLNNYETDFKLLESETNNRSYVKSIIVPKTCDVDSYSDYVASFCLNNGKKTMTEDELLIFLQLNGLATNKIPYDLRGHRRFKFAHNMVEVIEL